MNNFKDLEEFRADGLPVPAAVWMRLRSCLLRARNVLTTNCNENLKKNIEDFLVIPTKGSKRFRAFFNRCDSLVDNIKNDRSIITFYRLIDLPVPAIDVLTRCITLWSLSYLGNDFRDFSFKCRFNYLNLNNRRAAYDPDVNPLCSFCRIRDPDTDIRESFEHLFFSCTTASGLIDNLLIDCFDFRPANVWERKEFVWNGILPANERISLPVLFFWESFRFLIYRYKVRRRLPNFVMIKNELMFIINTSLYNQPNLKLIIQNNEALANWVQALG
jgi:hypothetical protein